HAKLDALHIDRTHDNNPGAHAIGAGGQTLDDCFPDSAAHGVKLRQYEQSSEIVAQMVLALIFGASLYFLFLLLLRQGWKKALRTHSIPPPSRQPTVSVVIAARNEAANLGAV